MKSAAALVLGVLTSAAQALEPTQLFERVSPSVWVVRTFDAEERPVGQGSAVVIGDGRLITNCHVLAKSKMVMVRRANVMYEAKLEHADAPRDLCLLTVANFSAPAVMVRSVKDLRVGERVYAIGNPKGLEVTLSEGLISGLRPVSDTADAGSDTLVQTSAALSPGSSGGGLFDVEGRLIGITTFGWRDAQNLNVALPADWIATVPERSQAALAKRESRSASSAGTRAENAAPGLPAPGTSWAYSFVERIFSRPPVEVTVRVLHVSDTIVEEAVTANAPGARDMRRVVNAREPRFLEFPLSTENAMVELAPYLVAVNGGEAPADAPRAEGYPLGSPSLPRWSVNVRIHGWEQITVPAGTFRALRVESEGRRSVGGRGGAQAGRFKTTAWYAPDVKRLVKLERKVWSADAFSPELVHDNVLELTTYRPPS